MKKIEPTGFCYNCGLVCKNLFCNPKCEKAYLKRQEKQNRPKIGRREGYGICGSCHQKIKWIVNILG